MTELRGVLLGRLQAAFDTVEPGADPVLRRSDHADFQANGAMAVAKRLGRAPREVAEQVVTALDAEGVFASAEVSGPGFVNLVLDDAFVTGQVEALGADERLGVGRAGRPRTVVVDYSSPNVAKEMHVGHLRSTVIGDALVRVLDFVGHRVVKENHVGDWGTPFGMLIEHLVDVGEAEADAELSVGDLTTFYQEARGSFDADESFRERSRRRVVLLQSGDPETLRLWRVLVDRSLAYFDEVYATLGVLLTDADVVGESFYNPMLPQVVEDLAAQGLLVEDHGALCVFPPGFTGRDGDRLPLIVRKSDEGYGYAATDLAAIRDRVGRIGAETVVYVVGSPQAQHLQMCFAVARMAKWAPDDVDLVHVAFGSVLDAQRKMFSTRAGQSVRLKDLLDEAVARAAAGRATRRAERGEEALDAETELRVARAIGIGAVKYADLSVDRVRDYVFEWDRMLATEGDTGPYLQYAHARIRSIFRRAGIAPPAGGQVVLEHQAERDLALALLGLGEAVGATLEAWAPNRLCTYLFELATVFTTFYEQCPVLKAPTDAQRTSRLALCALSARVLALGLGLLGIDAPEQM